MAGLWPGDDAGASHAPPMRAPEAVAADTLGRIDPARPLVVALSGGSDSTGLFVAFSLAARASGHRLVAASVDHGLRAGSDEEAREAGRMAARFGIPHVILPWTGPKPSTGLMQAARRARYRLLADHAEAIGASAVLLGHTEDDQSETIAMRRLRLGTHSLTSDGEEEAGGPGLAGMAPAVLFDGRIWFVRPFLGLRRQPLRAWLSAKGISWIEDPSNANVAFERVRIRADLAGRGHDAADDRAIGSAGGERQAAALAASRILDAALAMPMPGLFRLDPGLLAAARAAGEEAAVQAALSALIAVAGGADHRPVLSGQVDGANVFDLMSDDTGSGPPRRVTLSGALLERRFGKHGADALYILRERRNLGLLDLDAGSTADWDGRYRITNSGKRPVRIGPPGAFDASHARPLVDRDLGRAAGLPPAIRDHAISVLPYGSDADAAALAVRPLLAPWRDFLPAFDLPLANTIAKIAGMRQFDPPPGLPPCDLGPV